MKLKRTTIFVVSLLLFNWGKTSSSQHIAQEVLSQIYYSIGNFQTPLPTLEIVPTKEFMAAYHPTKNKILLEQQAYDVCQSFGKDSLNALAFLLAHELVHSYQKEGWASNFFSYDKHGDSSHHIEKSADVQGALGARLAGFNNQNLLSPLIQRLYERYELIGVQMEGYPSMEERQSTTKEVSEMVENLWHIYQSGNYLSVLGRHQMAAECYRYILDFYVGKEIYNNLALQYAQVAMTFSGKKVDPYLFPFELDTESRLRQTRSDALTPKERDIRRKLLNSSMAYFDLALQLDSKYFTAYINKLAIKVQKGNYQEVIELYESKRLSKKLNQLGADAASSAQARLVVGIAYASSGQKEKANSIFEALKKHADIAIQKIARINQSILAEKTLNGSYIEECAGLGVPAQPDGVSLFSVLNTPGDFLDPDRKIMHYWEAKPHSSIHVITNQKESFPFQRILSKKIKGPANVYVGGSLDRLLEQSEAKQYQIVAAGKHTFIHFPSCKLLFLVDKRRQIIEWTKYF